MKPQERLLLQTGVKMKNVPMAARIADWKIKI
jgi:hypothetical protein